MARQVVIKSENHYHFRGQTGHAKEHGANVVRRSILAVAAIFTGIAANDSRAADAMPEYRVTLQNHAFTPATLNVPSNTKFKVLVTNLNATPSEFESSDFNREKIVLPNSTITVFIGPLDGGTYRFFDDFDRAATGVLVVK